MPLSQSSRGALCIFLLACSSSFMTVAWYLQLKMHDWTLLRAVFFSWLIAGGEYCLQVPANRLGSASFGGPFRAPQLKVLAELCGLVAFGIFSTTVLKEKLRLTDAAGFVLILAGVAVAMSGRAAGEGNNTPSPPPAMGFELIPI